MRAPAPSGGWGLRAHTIVPWPTTAMRRPRRIKADPALKHIPIIVVTSYALSGDEAKARAAGCDAYVGKPYSPEGAARQNSQIRRFGDR